MRGNGFTKFLSLWLVVLSLLMFERLGKILPGEAPEASRAGVQQRLGLAMLATFGLAAVLTYLAFRFLDPGDVAPRPYTIGNRHSFRLMSYATVFSMILGCLSTLYFLWKLP
jgi:hypothetical protein